MDPQVQASFIPKKPLDSGGSYRGGGVGLLLLIALFIFVVSCLAAGGAFAYTQYLNGAIANKSSSLKLSEGAYDPGSIEDLVRIDSRITYAKSLLGKHVSPSAIFDFLSQQTLQNVSFSSFSYTLQPDGSSAISLSGQADSFSTVALQSDQFGASKVLKDVVFSGIAVGSSGAVSFSVAATVDPSLIKFSQTAAPASSGSTISPQTSSEQASTTSQ